MPPQEDKITSFFSVVEGTDYITITDFDTNDVCIERKAWTDFLNKLKKIRQLMKDNPEEAQDIIASLKNPTQSEPSPNPPTTPAPKPPSTAAPNPPTTPPANLPSAFADQGWFNFRIFDYMSKAPTTEKVKFCA